MWHLLPWEAGAQPLRAWWNGDYKCIAHDTGLELRPWKLKYPADINLTGETNAAFFDDNDSLQFFFPTGGTLYKRTDSIIYKPYTGGNGTCYQSALCFHDIQTDTVYFIGKPLSEGSSYLHSISLIKIHPNRIKYSVYFLNYIDSLDESMCAIKFNNGKIWAVFSKAESDEFTALELRSMAHKSTFIKYSREIKSIISSSVFHPSGKLIFYSTLQVGDQREHLLKKSTCLNFNPETGDIGYRNSVQYPAENQNGPTFDSTGNVVYLYSIQHENQIEKIHQIQINDWLKSDYTNMHECLSQVNISSSPVRFIRASNQRIYFNLGNLGYGIINKPEKEWPSCNIELVEVKNRDNAFFGWQESVPEQKKVPIDTFTFFNLTYPLNTVIGIPNAFTPNNDLLNDAFYLTFNPQIVLSGFKVRIFSRWGVEVFQSEDPHFYWDGTFKNKPVPEGTYYYFISLFNQTTGKSETHQGPLVLMR